MSNSKVFPYDVADQTTYKMKVIFLDTGSMHVRPSQEVLDYFIQENKFSGLSLCIVAERILSYAGDIALDIVASRSPNYYARMTGTIAAEIERIWKRNIGDCQGYWMRRVIDLHRTTDYNTFPGIIVWGFDLATNSSVRELVLKNGAQCILLGTSSDSQTLDFAYDAKLIDPTNHNFKLALKQVINSNQMMDVRPLYEQQPEYTAEIKAMQESLTTQLENEKK